MEMKILSERHLKKRGPFPELALPDVVAELPEKVVVELETVNFYPFNPMKTNLVFRLKE